MAPRHIGVESDRGMLSSIASRMAQLYEQFCTPSYSYHHPFAFTWLQRMMPVLGVTALGGCMDISLDRSAGFVEPRVGCLETVDDTERKESLLGHTFPVF